MKLASAALLAAVAREVVPVLSEAGQASCFGLVDDTSFRKYGKHSVGVARQYCGQLGKTDNCQVAVSLSLATVDGSVPLDYRLYLPHEWAEDKQRRKLAGVPNEIAFATKGKSAMTDIASDQRFTLSHLDEADFKPGGLRSYSSYRDLGVAAATHGLATAHVIRMIEPFAAGFSQRHHHDVQFQLVYVLKGWFKTDFEGHGVRTMNAGSCWIQPPGIRHTVVGWSDDCELLEVILPAEHETFIDE